MRVLGVGVATLDIINNIDSYPRENEEVRVLSQRSVRGGNATNTLVILSQQGHACSWAGVLPQGPDASFVLADLSRYQINIDFCSRPQQGKLPTSYINLSQATGSRTIVHYRDLPEYSFNAFDAIDLTRFDWIHFEGRNVAELKPMLEKAAASPGLGCSLEIEKPRQGIEALFPLADILLFSRNYAVNQGYAQAGLFLQHMTGQFKELYLAWGELGAWAMDDAGQIYHSLAFQPHPVRDTLGAGDVFNAGIIHSRIQGSTVPESLDCACRLAGYKCGVEGFSGVVV
jgi:ketohexokinase